MTEKKKVVLADKQIMAMRKALVDFGYSDLSDKFVREKAEEILKGDEPTEIIGMFLKSFLEEAKLI